MPIEDRFEKEVNAVEFTKEELERFRREAIRLGLTPEQDKFIQWVADIRKRGYVNANTSNLGSITPTSELFNFILNPTDANGTPYNFVTVLVNTDENEGEILLPTISQIVEQNIYPNISGNFGFQLKIFNNGSNGNSVFVRTAIADQFGTSETYELGDNASLVLSPVSSNNWSVILTK
jgi:hypothetical protein